ncbi:FecR family protein [Thalassospira povalilytica]|uniref:FecR domain-containing protein n=1 Tax=Thalassospira povalilytica TaxID=732237 RepID=A0A8I1SK68_9PROT|nr:FecR domain-containing protein [Thalassospira povalilytica]MBN8197649.1 FecR domain-containing protein [Thalassospira povalilytica]
MQGQHIPTDAQKDEAALWHVKRAGGSMSVAQEGEFDAWINADPGNRLAYDQMRVLWAQVEEPARRMSTAMTGEKTRFDKVRQWFSPGRAFAGVAGAVAVGTCVFFFNPDMVENIRADIVTENETVTDVTLTDGSIVHLAANSAIATDFSDGRRDVELLRGQAFFEVTHRNGDRFRVHAGPAMIEVVGTRFNVDYLSRNTEIAVEEGAVRVSGNGNPQGVLLGAGDRVAVSTAASLGDVEKTDPTAIHGWMQGRLSVRNVTVGDLVARLDNFASGRLVALGDVSERTISGSFPTTDVVGSLETVAAAVGAKVIRTSPWLTVIY